MRRILRLHCRLSCLGYVPPLQILNVSCRVVPHRHSRPRRHPCSAAADPRPLRWFLTHGTDHGAEPRFELCATPPGSSALPAAPSPYPVPWFPHHRAVDSVLPTSGHNTLRKLPTAPPVTVVDEHTVDVERSENILSKISDRYGRIHECGIRSCWGRPTQAGLNCQARRRPGPDHSGVRAAGGDSARPGRRSARRGSSPFPHRPPRLGPPTPSGLIESRCGRVSGCPATAHHHPPTPPHRPDKWSPLPGARSWRFLGHTAGRIFINSLQDR